MIEFDCPFCGKHYSFSSRFAGKAMFCTVCKTPLNVPQPEEIPPRLVVPPPLPSSIPLPPPLPIPLVTPESDINHFGFVAPPLTENYQEFQNAPSSSPISPQTELDVTKKSRLFYWGSIGTIILVAGGLGLFGAFGIDWRGADQRQGMLEKIDQQKVQAVFNANNKEAESNTLWLQSLELWNEAGETIDAFTVTLGGNVTKLDGKETAAEQRLGDLRNMIQSAVKQAVEAETAQETTVRDAKRYRAESKFYEQQETELREQIQRFPNNRTPVTLKTFDPEEQPILKEKPLRFDSDWTENHFDYFGFDFPEAEFSKESADYFYAVFDGVKRLYGRQSLRISVLKKTPITIIFPPEKAVSANSINRIKPENAGCFAFSIRFPELVDPLRAGNDIVAGKIGGFRVRFVYPTSHVDFETTSPRYCEALFYDGCGMYIPIEFPLIGNAFWRRTEQFNETNIDIGNAPIDRIEIQLTPLSDRTTFWLDGIALTEKVSSEPYDLLQAEARQAEIRKRDAQLSKTNTASLDNEQKEPQETDSAQPDNSENLFQWVLQIANGKISVRQNDETISFDSQRKIPETLEGMIVEEIDLTDFHHLTENRLDQIGGLKDLKRLNLSRTGLKNGDLIKLATLTSLESLNLAGNELTFGGLPAIRTLKRLKELNLDGIRISAEGIDALGTLNSLRSLCLSRSSIDNSDILYLLPLTDLETLDLSSTKIGDRGLPIFRVFTGLKTLNLSKTRITDVGIASLIPLPNLKELNLDDTALDNVCLENLGKIKQLESISVRNTGITSDGVQKTLGNAKLGCFKFKD